MGSNNKLTPLEPGARAPEFRLPALDGASQSLAEILARGPALLAFFKISCPVCQLAAPYLERLHQAGSLAIYGISQNDEPDTRAFAQRYGLTFPILLDLESTRFPVSNAYGLTNVPTMYLTEPGGTIAKTIHGWNKREMSAFGVIRSEDNVPEWKAG